MTTEVDLLDLFDNRSGHVILHAGSLDGLDGAQLCGEEEEEKTKHRRTKIFQRSNLPVNGRTNHGRDLVRAGQFIN